MSTRENHSALVSSMDTFVPHHDRLRSEKIANNNINNNYSNNNNTSSSKYSSIQIGFRFLNRTSNGLMIYSSLIIIITFLLTASRAEKPSITHQGSNVSEVHVAIKSDVKIHCESNNSNLNNMKWHKLQDSKWIDVEEHCQKKKNSKSKSTCYVSEDTVNKTKVLVLTLNDITADDYGDYSCGILVSDSPNNDKLSQQIKIRDIVKIYKKFNKGTNSTIVEEGLPALLDCTLQRGNDKKYKVAWRVADKYTKPNEAGEVLLGYEDWEYFENSTYTSIKIPAVNSSHRGWYQCILYEPAGNCQSLDKGCINTAASFEIQLRIKETILPLYPLITICVEIIVISAIIIIYERSKGTAEVEESDTDGSPDQKLSDNNGEAEAESESTRLAKA